MGQNIDQFWIEHETFWSRTGSFETSYIWKSSATKYGKIISVAQSVCKAIHQVPGTGWLPSDIKNHWHQTFLNKLEGIKAFPTWSEVTSAE